MLSRRGVDFPAFLSAAALEGWGHPSAPLKHPHDPRRQPRPGTSPWPLVVTKARDSDTDPGCCRVTWSFDGSMGQDLAVASGDGTGHSQQAVPHSPWVSNPTSLHGVHTILLLSHSSPPLACSSQRCPGLWASSTLPTLRGYLPLSCFWSECFSQQQKEA